MKARVKLQDVLTNGDKTLSRRLGLFALINLGMIDSLVSGVLSADKAVRVFYNADNCLFVRKELRDKTADKIMSHGVQLPDLFDVLAPDEAHREFQHELSAMRTLCLKLLKDKRLVA
jgi:hypothetical protein